MIADFVEVGEPEVTGIILKQDAPRAEIDVLHAMKGAVNTEHTRYHVALHDVIIARADVGS